MSFAARILCAVALMAAAPAAAQQPPPPPPPPPQQDSPPPDAGDDGRNERPRRSDRDGDRAGAPAMVLAAGTGESIGAVRLFEDPVLGFGNDDLWSWEAVADATDMPGGQSVVAVDGAPD